MNSGLSVYAKLMLLSPEAKKTFTDIQTIHRFESELPDPAYAVISLDVRNGTGAEVVAKIDEMLKGDFWQFFPIKDMLSYVADENKLSVCVRVPSRIAPLIEPYKEMIQVIQDQLQVDQSVEACIRLAAKPKDLLTEGGEPLIMQLLDGISIDIKLNLWKKLADLVLKLIESGNFDASLFPILGGIAPAFLLRINANLDLTIDDYMKAKIRENPLVEPVLMDAPTLISSMSGKSFENDEEFYAHVASSVPPPFNELAEILARHMGDRIDFTLSGPFGGIKGHVDGEGLHLILQNGLKFLNP